MLAHPYSGLETLLLVHVGQETDMNVNLVCFACGFLLALKQINLDCAVLSGLETLLLVHVGQETDMYVNLVCFACGFLLALKQINLDCAVLSGLETLLLVHVGQETDMNWDEREMRNSYNTVPYYFLQSDFCITFA